MKKFFSLCLIILLLLTSITIPVAALEPEDDVVLWNTMNGEQVADGVTLKEGKTSVDNSVHFPGTIQDAADWNGQYDMIGALLPNVISGKVVNLSFDYYPEASSWGAPCFRVDVFEQNQAYAEGSDKWFLGFYAYDEPGRNDHTKDSNDQYLKYYDDTKSFFTYYGNEDAANSEPYDKTAEEWVNGKAAIAFKTWQHIDCVYDLVNRTVSFYVDGTFLGTSAGPSSIGALAFRKKNYANSTTVYYGKARFDNIRLTEVKEGSLGWETQLEPGSDSFLVNFSEPVNVLAKGMITLTDMETLTTSKAASTEKITPYQWRVNIENAKKNAEYKVDITALTSIFGGTPKSETTFAYTENECREDVSRELVNTNFEGSSVLPDGWTTLVSDSNFGTADEETRSYIETVGTESAKNNRIRIQNIGEWNTDKKYGIAAAYLPLSLSTGATKVEIEFDAAYQKDTTLLPVDDIRAANTCDAGTTGAMGSVGLDVGTDSSHWAKQTLNFGSNTLYLEDKWGSKYNGTPIPGVTLSNSLDDMNRYKMVFDVATSKVTLYCEEAEIGSITYDAETKLYGVRFFTIMSAKAGDAAADDAVLDADSNVMVVDNVKVTETYDEQTFGIKKVRYDAVESNVTETIVSSHTDDFSAYVTAGDPEKNKENADDYAETSDGMWARSGHTKTSSWWGQGSYVNTSGQLSIDAYSNTNSITVGAVRQINEDAAAVKNSVLNVNFDMAYYVLQQHEGSSFTMYAGEYPIFGADRENVYLYNEQLTDEKISLGSNSFATENYGKDLQKVQLKFDFANREIRINFGGMVKTTAMYEELAENGVGTLKFAVNLLNGIVGGNGVYRGNAFVMDNYSDAVVTTSDVPVYIEDVDATNILVPTTAKINIEFMDKVDESTVSGINIVDEKGAVVDYTPSSSEDGKSVTLAVALKPETSYKMTIPVTITSADNVTNGREYIYTFTTDRAVKFFDISGNEITEEELATTAFADVKILTNAPAGTGKFVYGYAIYDKETELLKDVRIQEISYTDGDVIDYDDAVKISDDECAKVFLWETMSTLKAMGKNYTFGK